MWAKNGQSVLPLVLRRISKVIPSEVINEKIFVDDHSVDNSIIIAKSFGWTVFKNEKGGVGAGANLALSKIHSKYFVSIEQDVLLARDWWDKIPKYLESRDVVAAQGCRISNHPVIGKIDEYHLANKQSSFLSIFNAMC